METPARGHPQALAGRSGEQSRLTVIRSSRHPPPGMRSYAPRCSVARAPALWIMPVGLQACPAGSGGTARGRELFRRPPHARFPPPRRHRRRNPRAPRIFTPYPVRACLVQDSGFREVFPETSQKPTGRLFPTRCVHAGRIDIKSVSVALEMEH